MRLIRLDLERYGPFTDRTVTFRPDARLHVVIGPNEAGKTSALAAVTDLLFGIEHRTRHAHKHDMSLLRLGAEIEAADGTRFAFRRRKGLRNTLVDGSDGPMPEDALAPFLKGLTREVFCRAFGLDAESLRSGGHEMMDVNGEVGASLFAAGSGLRGYTALQSRLDEEAQRIFAPRRAKDRSFYQALDRFEDARKAIRATELREGAWRDLNEEIAAARAKLDTIRTTRERIASDRAGLERLKRVAPLIASIDEAAARAQDDPTLVAAGDAEIARLGGALERVYRSQAEAARAQAALATAQADLASLPPRSPLIALADPILECFRGIDRFDKDGVDLPRIQTDMARLDEELDRLAIRVGLDDGATLMRAQPSDAQRARVDELVREGRDIAAGQERARSEAARARAEHETLEREQPQDGLLVDPRPLLEALASFASLRRDIAETGQLEATIERAAKVLRGQAARLSPPVPDTAHLAAAPLPSLDAVARFRTLFDGIERERGLAQQRMKAGQSSVASTEARIREREGGRPIASREALLAARSERDDAFAPLREALQAGRRAEPGDIPAFDRAVHETDRLADALATDAERVASQAADLARIEGERADLAESCETLARLDTQHADLHAAWIEAWRPVEIVPTSPSEMAQWLQIAASLIEAQDDLDARRVDARLIAKRVAAAAAPLEALATRIGLSDIAALDPGRLLDRIEGRVNALARRWEETRELNARLRAAAVAIERQDAALAEIGERKAAWRAAWSAAIPEIGLSVQAGIGQAEAALAAWREVPALLRERDGAARRVRGMERDRESFRGEVARLIEAAPDLDATAPSRAIRTLHQRLQVAQSDEVRRMELERRCEQAQRANDAALTVDRTARADLDRALASLESAAASGTVDDAQALHARLLRRRGLQADLASRRGELLRVADGIDESTLRVGLAATTMDAIEAALANLAADQDANDRDGQIAYALHHDAERRRDDLEAGTGAELAYAQRKAAEAELAASARQWAVLRLAHLMLGTAIGRYRSGQQNPLLVAAGGFFHALTGGAFVGLAQDFGEADESRIVGRRPSGESVSVDGLSEGTRDQLYFALRLAYLQDYAARSEPAPFLGDDLFLTFDDARTAHGLDALAAIGAHMQPILFTHHRHVAQLAEARLGKAADIIAL